MDKPKLKEIQYQPLTCQISNTHCCLWSEDNSLASLTKSGILIVGFQRLAPMVFLFSLLVCLSNVGANDITNLAFGDHIPGIPAAFGDFNSDEFTDLFTIKQEDKGSSMEILLGRNTEPYLQYDKNLVCKFSNHVITSVVPGDFDEDVKMDVLVTAKNTKNTTDTFTYVFVHKGFLNSIECAKETNYLIKMKGQPTVLDYNKDMIMDLFGEDSDGKRVIWEFHANNTSNITLKRIPLSSDNANFDPLRRVHSNAFIDLDHDSDADLYITSEKHTSEKQLEFWYRHKGKNFTKGETEQVASNKETIVGQTTFLDFQSTGELYQLIPTCIISSGLGCEKSEIIVVKGSKKIQDKLHISFVDKSKKQWNFAYNASTEYFLNAITLRAGDFNMDGFPDLIATLSPEKDNTYKQTFLLLNVQCPGDCGTFQRTFKVQWDELSTSNNNTILGVFYDFLQDGILDVIFVQQQDYKVTAFRNSLDYDANFLKAMVISARQQNAEAQKTIPLGRKYRTYGTNLPGPTIGYNTTTADGDPQTGSSAQLPQSAHFSLIQPYTIFGLGRSPNFVDSLTVYFFGGVRSWTQLIPNSQIIVIPYPLDQPTYWRAQLFVTPSAIIYKSALALLGTCIFISLIIGVLHWKERKEDKREKLQQAHRFHFDAM